MDEPSNISPSGRLDRVLQALKRDYLIIGNGHIKAWQAWLVLGLVVGVAAGVILVANRSGEFEKGRAEVATNAIVVLDPNVKYQKMIGWEASTQSGQSISLQFLMNVFPKYKDMLFDLAINDLGINQLRMGTYSGNENTADYWDQRFQGTLSTEQYVPLRYASVNDNSDPFAIQWNGFHFSQLDNEIVNVVLPMRRLLTARGEKLYVNLTYIAFGGPIYHRDNPDEYAEFILANFLYMQKQYGFVPDAVEIILEPDNIKAIYEGNTGKDWSGTHIGKALVAAAKRLEANGFHPDFIAPSVMNPWRAVPYLDEMLRNVPEVKRYLTEFSYHRYGLAFPATFKEIGQNAASLGIGGAMLEKIGASYRELYQDLTLARNSSWQQFALAFPKTDDDGGLYYLIDDTDPSNPKVIMGSRTKFLRQYFKFIRSGAVRIDAKSNNPAFGPVAFVNTNGKYVVVVNALFTGTFSIKGLPAAIYGVKYTTSTQYDVDAPDVTLVPGSMLTANIPSGGVITIYQK